MGKNLVIVESPTKARTIKRYLGNNFDVRASFGHIKDLPTKTLGVDIEHDFTPQYEVIRGKAKVLKELKTAASGVEDIYLAPDPDREGEAIAWHIADELAKNGKKNMRFHRVLFRELTEKAIKEAINAPVELDKNKFESQQARRILDRLVGYQLSPILWDKVKRGLSAGRVQSVAVKIICDREREIRAFVQEEYWSVHARLKAGLPPEFLAKVISKNGKKLTIPDKKTAEEITAFLKNTTFNIAKVQTKEKRRQPPPPFITSTLQQEAARRLRFSAKKTMTIAQMLYEGIDLGEEGPVGLITYMRTDSTRLASEAINAARDFIKETFGKDYVPSKAPSYKSGKLAQDAHEAIRPTSVSKTPENLAGYLTKDALALYELIWKRFVASQMAPAILDQTQVDIDAAPYMLRANGTIMRFPGFTVLYSEKKDEERPDIDEDEADSGDLPQLSNGEGLDLVDLIPKQHFTQPPPRYTEASLIKTLEEKGIGRPSTYATILSTIQEKEYVRMEQGHFVPTELGFVVTDLLMGHFSEILDTGFTADMERQLDEIEEGKTSWLEVLNRFYSPFKKSLDAAKTEMPTIKRTGVATNIKCNKCGAPMVIKYGRSGEFLACSAYPECKNTSDFTRDEKGEIKIAEKKAPPPSMGICDKCGRPMVVKKSKFSEFIACSGYPECKNTKPLSTDVPCPAPGCNGQIVKKRTKTGRTFYGCNRYPECQYVSWDEPVNEKCPDCGSPILVVKSSKDKKRILKCPVKGCGYKREPE
ncbi:MAG: type I DNA topoisomerase [Dissulfurimicrobium sp.]|uniref:type I DNA topoisomerase n=1 Tax=Dissulfurimicrobium sp. TaxID=2022436 RepID=UPI00404932D4